MRQTRTTRTLWWVSHTLWACILVNAAWHALPPYDDDVPPLARLLATPAVAAGFAPTLTLSLVAWHLLTPLSQVYAAAQWATEQRMRGHHDNDARRASGDRVVVPMPRGRR